MVCPISQPATVSLAHFWARQSLYAQGRSGSRSAQGSNEPNFVLGGVFSVASGRRYYNPELGRWINRDPIGEGGGENVYALLSNTVVNRVDVLGLWPRWITCTLLSKSTPSAWTLDSFIPKGLVQGGNGAFSSEATCIYTRTATETYDCSCCKGKKHWKGITQVYTKTATVGGPGTMWFWITPGGSWPPSPTSTLKDLIAGIIGGSILPPYPADPTTKNEIKGQCNGKIPDSSEGGTPSKSPPKKWCWW